MRWTVLGPDGPPFRTVISSPTVPAESRPSAHRRRRDAGSLVRGVIWPVLEQFENALRTRAARFADRARGYGFPGVAVDGNDLFAVYEVTRRAVERARAGRGPTMIEAVTYRIGFHNTSDNPSLYRDHGEVVEASGRDPIARLSAYAVNAGLVDQNALGAQQTEARAEVDAALERALTYAAPGPEEAFRHIFAD